MPRQNRVTPFGALIATESRGTLMGNRGCLHNDAQRIRRPFVGRRWIACVLEFRGRRRRVMTPGRYTELFFLDEATALAAGHRPCAECQRDRYLRFRAVWTAANPDVAPSGTPSADAIDAVLHAERLGPNGAKRTYRERLSRLPGGVMVSDGTARAWLVQARTLVPWTPAGYGPPVPRAAAATVQVLTPRTIVRALAAGFPVGVHATAGGGA